MLIQQSGYPSLKIHALDLSLKYSLQFFSRLLTRRYSSYCQRYVKQLLVLKSTKLKSYDIWSSVDRTAQGCQHRKVAQEKHFETLYVATCKNNLVYKIKKDYPVPPARKASLWKKTQTEQRKQKENFLAEFIDQEVLGF